MKNKVYLRGGSIGEQARRKEAGNVPVHVAETEADAKEYAKRMNKILSPGEKKYYGLKYYTAI